MSTLEEFRSVHLIERLRKEAPALFDKLSDLWTAVQPSIKNVNILFPEYTPHDITHLQRLFDISEKILGSKLLSDLNHTECFLLSAAIVAHDWGMGVSASEQEAIINGQQGLIDVVGPDNNHYHQVLLSDEQRQLTEHQLLRGIKLEWNKDTNSLANQKLIDIWRDYLRDTHPERSAQRIRSHFISDKSIGRNIALISHGHGRNPSVIEDTQQYASHKLLNGELVNIQALTLYLRLVDLLDIGKGRTPYELWLYINPGNQQSAAEWKKHHAMEEPVVDGDFIRFSALTRDGAILAELFNLKDYCETELDWQWRLLHKSSHHRYWYSCSRMEWNIETEGSLHNTPVRFEFAREELLRLLSDEIYDGDPYVFLRGLVQNAIDATKTRVERRRSTEAPLEPCHAAIIIDTAIDNSTITVRDFGSGMTDYVIENYLAVAGRSYYRSRDFIKLGLKFDPISRFGIGILSCFVVAERVIIKTRTDPECFANGSSVATEAWQVEIPSGRDGLPVGYWQWTQVNPESMRPGTEVTVVIDPKKLKVQMSNLQQPHRADGLNVKEYLKAVAAFTEFPIYISERNDYIVIVPPMIDVNTVLDSSRSGYRVEQLQLQYDLAEHVNALELTTANEYLSVETVEFRDLGLFYVEGALSYPKPKFPWRVVARQARELTLNNGEGTEIKITGPRWTSGDKGFMEDFHVSGMCKSAKRFKRSGVYFQGILLPDTAKPKDVGIHGRYTSTLLAFPNIFLNYKKHESPEQRPVPSRRSLRDSANDWPNKIFAAHAQKLAQESRIYLLGLEPTKRLNELLRILEHDFVSLKDFAAAFEWEEWPVPVLLEGGNVDVRLLRDLRTKDRLVQAPNIITEAASSNLTNRLGYPMREMPSLKKWKHDLCVFNIQLSNVPEGVRQYTSTVLSGHFDLHHDEVALSAPSLKGGWRLPPLYTTVWKKNAAPERLSSIFPIDNPVELLEKGICSPGSLTEKELLQIKPFAPTSLRFRRVSSQVPKDFSRYLLWNVGEINVEHTNGEALCRAHCAYAKARLQNRLLPIEQARIEQTLSGLPIQWFNLTDPRKPMNSLRKLNEFFVQLKQMIESTEKLNLHHFPKIELTMNDFLPGPFNFTNSDEFFCLSLGGNAHDIIALFSAFNEEEFGEFLTDKSPWPPQTFPKSSSRSWRFW